MEDLVSYPSVFDCRKDKYLKLAQLFIKKYYNLEIKTKKDFCKKYSLSLNTLNKYLRTFDQIQVN